MLSVSFGTLPVFQLSTALSANWVLGAGEPAGPVTWAVQAWTYLVCRSIWATDSLPQSCKLFQRCWTSGHAVEQTTDQWTQETRWGRWDTKGEVVGLVIAMGLGLLLQIKKCSDPQCGAVMRDAQNCHGIWGHKDSAWCGRLGGIKFYQSSSEVIPSTENSPPKGAWPPSRWHQGRGDIWRAGSSLTGTSCLKCWLLQVLLHVLPSLFVEQSVSS